MVSKVQKIVSRKGQKKLKDAKNMTENDTLIPSPLTL